MLPGVVVLGSAPVAELVRIAFARWSVPVSRTDDLPSAADQADRLLVIELDEPARWARAAAATGRLRWLIAHPDDLERALSLGAEEVLTSPLRKELLAPLAEIWGGQGLVARALRALGTGLEITDQDGVLLYVNPTWERDTGFSSAQATGRTPAELLRSPLHTDDFHEHVWTELSAGRPWSGPYISRTRDGESVLQQLTVAPISLPQDPGHLVATRQPISSKAGEEIAELRTRVTLPEKSPLHQRLRASQSKYRALVAWAIDGILIADFDTARIIEANPAAETMWGYSQAEFQELFGRQLTAERSRPAVDQISRELREQGWAIAPRIACRRKDGSEFWCAMRIRVFSDGENRYEVSFTHDITDQVAREEALAAESRLAAAGRVAAGVAHDLNNPAAYIQINLALMQEALESARGSLPGPLRQELTELLRECTEGMARIQASTSELASLARTARPADEPVQLDDIVRSAARMVLPVVRHRARLEVAECAPMVVHGSGDQLVRVVTNLLLNAAEAIEEGPAVDNAVQVSLTLEAATARLVIQDTGKGMAPELLAKAFEPFVSSKVSERGSGLGLWLVQQIVTSHGGTILLDSEPGRGTRVVVGLPARAGQITAGLMLPLVATRADPRPLRVLVVDDESAIRRAFSRALRRLGTIETVSGGHEAVQLLDQGASYDVVVCDMMMPDMDGQELYLWIAQHRPELVARIVFCTGGSMTPRSAVFLQAVNRPILQKPLGPSELREAVQAVADGRDFTHTADGPRWFPAGRR